MHGKHAPWAVHSVAPEAMWSTWPNMNKQGTEHLKGFCAMVGIFGQIVGCSACYADHLPEGCTWRSGVEAGLLPWQAAPHLPETHDSHPIASRPRQDEEGLQGLLVEDPQPVHQPRVGPHRLHEQRQQLSQLLRYGLPIQTAPKPVQPSSYGHLQALGNGICMCAPKRSTLLSAERYLRRMLCRQAPTSCSMQLAGSLRLCTGIKSTDGP